MSQWLTERLGQSVVVENRPGGGTNIAVQAVVNAPPDGYTLLFTVVTQAINPSLYKSLPFDFRRDIAPVAGLAELPLVLVVNPQVPARTVAEFLERAKAEPGKTIVASFGARTVSHLSIELIKSAAGVDVLHVPYQGGAPMMTDLISGRIQAGVDALPNCLPHIRAGSIRALAVLPVQRSPVLPDVPTIGETIAGLEVSTWSGSALARESPATPRSGRAWSSSPASPRTERSASCVGRRRQCLPRLGIRRSALSRSMPLRSAADRLRPASPLIVVSGAQNG
jgi:tripartite-type tricarboxylate transporter receptor subunit TctC